MLDFLRFAAILGDMPFHFGLLGPTGIGTASAALPEFFGFFIRSSDRSMHHLSKSSFQHRWAVTLVATVAGGCLSVGVANSQTATPLTLDSYDVQCGVFSSDGLPEGAKARFTSSSCKLFITLTDDDVTQFYFTGSIQGRKLSWTFEGDAKLNIFKQLAPQTGGKFNRSVRNGLACFVPFHEEGSNDLESLVCYTRSTLRNIYGWDRKSGAKFPIP